MQFKLSILLTAFIMTLSIRGMNQQIIASGTLLNTEEGVTQMNEQQSEIQHGFIRQPLTYRPSAMDECYKCARILFCCPCIVIPNCIRDICRHINNNS